LPWSNVVEPIIELAREGFVISKDLADEVSKTDYEIFSTGPLNPGDRLQLQELTKMLDIVAHYGAKGIICFVVFAILLVVDKLLYSLVLSNYMIKLLIFSIFF